MYGERVLCKREPVKYTFILAQLMMYPLSVVCPVLGVTQSGFHFWRKREPSMREQERERLRVDIGKAFDDNHGRYGAARIYKVMCAQHGYTGSRNRIQTLMRAMASHMTQELVLDALRMAWRVRTSSSDTYRNPIESQGIAATKRIPTNNASI